MVDSILNLILNIKKGGKGDKEAASGLDAFGKKVGNVVQNSKKNMDILKNTVGAATKLIGDAFKLAAEEAERLGRTEVTAQMKEMNDSFKTVTDTLVQIPIGGRDFLAWMGDAAEGAANLGKTISALSIFIAQNTGAMSDSEAAMKAALLVQGPVVLSTEQLAQAQEDLADPLDESNRLQREYKTAAENAATASALAAQKAYDYQVATEKLTGPVSDLQFAMGELTTATLFNQAAQGLDAEASLALATAMGLVDEKALAAKDKLDELRIKFDENKDGVIDATEAANGYTAAVIRMNQELSGTLQWLRDVQAEMNSMPGGIEGRAGGATGDGYATGGSFVVGGSGGTDSTPVMFWATPGEKVTVETPAQQTANNTTNNSSESIVNHFHISSYDPRGVAQEVSRVIASQLRAARSAGSSSVAK